MDDVAPTPQMLDDINNNNNNDKFSKMTKINDNDDNEEGNLKIKNSMEFKIIFQDKSYLFKIYIKENKKYLYLEVVSEKDLISNYIYKYGLYDLINLDKIFKTCDNIDDAYELMVSNIKEDKDLIKSIDEDKLILKIKLLQGNRSVNEKEIILKKKYVKTEIIIEKLYKEINELKIQNNKMKKANQ